MTDDAPSAYSIEIAMSVAQATITRLREEGTLGDGDDDEDQLLRVLEGHGVEIGNLLERIVAAAVEAELLVGLCSARIDDLVARRQRFDRLAQAWRGTALAIMHALEIRRHRAAEFTITLGEGLPRVVVTDEEKLPEEYWRISKEPSKTLIKADIEQGVLVPGAEMGIGPPRLVIRTS